MSRLTRTSRASSLIEYIVRSRAAPVDPDQFRASLGTGAGVEYLADIIRSSLFVAQGHRPDVRLSLVLEKSRDYSRIVSFAGQQLGSLGDLHESALLDAVMDALKAGANLNKDEQVTDARGVEVTATSFEHLVKARAMSGEVFVLDPKGEDIRELEFTAESVFVMTDHTPMPKNTFKSMARQGVRAVSVGPVMLHASQCIALINNECDRRQLFSF